MTIGLPLLDRAIGVICVIGVQVFRLSPHGNQRGGKFQTLPFTESAYARKKIGCGSVARKKLLQRLRYFLRLFLVRPVASVRNLHDTRLWERGAPTRELIRRERAVLHSPHDQRRTV